MLHTSLYQKNIKVQVNRYAGKYPSLHKSLIFFFNIIFIATFFTHNDKGLLRISQVYYNSVLGFLSIGYVDILLKYAPIL